MTLDIAGYNYIDRLYGTNTYVPERARFPHRLCLGTETSSGIHYWLGVRDHDYVIGDFIWTGIDYLGETRKFPKRGNGSGFLDLAAGKKPGFYQRAAYWRDDPVLQIFVLTGEKPELAWRAAPAVFKWNWPTNAQLTVRAVANCDEVELFLNNHPSDAMRFPTMSMPATGACPTLRECSRRSVIAPASRLPRMNCARPARRATPGHAAPIAHPSDIAFYEITVVDDAGLLVSVSSPASRRPGTQRPFTKTPSSTVASPASGGPGVLGEKVTVTPLPAA
jgi:hypothetical protein